MESDPYKLFGLSKEFTLDDLKKAYKKLALQVHPDKLGGNETLFLYVTKCFKTLHKEHNRRTGDKQYHELKATFQKQMEQKQSTEAASATSKRFNLEKFNKIFSENKLQDVTDVGYEEWMKHNDVQEAKELKQFTKEGFNRHFEKYTANDKNNKFIMRYKEPEPLETSKKITFTELGKDNMDDFSGDNTTRKQLNFMDYRVAHTTSRIVDPRALKNVKQYRNIDELERDRAGISFQMGEKEMEEYLAKQKLENIREKQRQEYLAKRDEQIANHFKRTNMMMLGT
jgi:curved DNA-binding protein CbpA